MAGAPLREAARELEVHPRTLARWLGRGAPAVRRGRRGRGGEALVDVDAIRLWLNGAHDEAHVDLRVLAVELPDLVAQAVYEAHLQVDGPHKYHVAGTLAATWYVVVSALLDRLRREVPDLAGPTTVPPQIERLRSIFADFGRTEVNGAACPRWDGGYDFDD